MFNILSAGFCVYLPERPGEGKRRILKEYDEDDLGVNLTEKARK